MFARTQRLLLRPGWAEDAPVLARTIGDEAIARNLARVPWPYDADMARDFLAMERDPHLPDFLIFARTKGAPRLVGGCGLSRTPQGEIELGYWIARAHWGLGYATEAGRAVIEIARTLKLGHIVAGHFVDNPASAKVLRKLGFRPTGKVVRRQSLARGDSVPCAGYVLADDEEDARMAA